MSLFDDASLVLIPDGAKDGTLYSVKPTDGTGDFTFTRGSNLAATRVDENGLIEKGRENEVLYSNVFTGATWVQVNITQTTGFSDPFGGSNANKFLETTANDLHRFYNSFQVKSHSIYTQSVYVKPIGRSQILYGTQSNSLNFVYDFTTESIVSTFGSMVDYGVTSVGNGWYRFSLTFVVAANFNHSFLQGYVGGSTIYAGDVTKGFYAYGSQLEAGLVATDYIETTTTTAQAGILEDMPRLDYSGGTCPALLLEPQRTNLLPYSEYFDAWTKFNSSVEVNAVASPDGYANASKLIPNTSATSHQINYSISGGAHTTSVFAKAGEYSTLALFYTVHDGRAVFNLSSGTITETSGTVTASIEDFGNGWYRCILSTTLTTHDYIRIYAINGTTWADTSVAGDGTSGIYIYGAMLESGSYPTSYIPTYGTSVTRGADSCSKTGISSLIGQTEGTLFVEVDFETLSGINMFVSIRPDASNKIEIYRSDAIIYGEFASSVSFNFSASSVTVGRYKIAVAYSSGSSAMYINGVLVGSNTTPFAFTSTLDDIYINSRNGSSYIEQTKYKQAAIFPTRLTDAELAALTSL